jgi:nicotinamide-nucleotide amidase
MTAEIIAIGDELLIGQTINTNAAWLGQECSQIGIRILRSIVISDDENEILESVERSMNNADVVFVTGGLGPTKDDITKHTLCKYFNTQLVRDEVTLNKIRAYFSKRNRPMLEANERQADLPECCTILANNFGTAAGMWFEKDGSILISMPGVPYEMKAIVTGEVMPRLSERFRLQSIFHKTLLVQGIGESFLAEQISDWENRVRNAGLSLAYLPSPGLVKLRITSSEGRVRSEEIDAYFEELKQQFPEFIFGTEKDTLTSVLHRLCHEYGVTLGTVESCTGGAIAQSLTELSGASAIFKGGIVSYVNELKSNLVGVQSETLLEYSAVSKQVAEQMAFNGLNKLDVDLCISSTGIMGPEGATDTQPLGTVWIAVATKKTVESKCFSFGDNRERNIVMTVLTALNFARNMILSNFPEKNKQ